MLVWGLPNLQPENIMPRDVVGGHCRGLNLVPRSMGNDKSNAHLVIISARVSKICTHHGRFELRSQVLLTIWCFKPLGVVLALGLG